MPAGKARLDASRNLHGKALAHLSRLISTVTTEALWGSCRKSLLSALKSINSFPAQSFEPGVSSACKIPSTSPHLPLVTYGSLRFQRQYCFLRKTFPGSRPLPSSTASVLSHHAVSVPHHACRHAFIQQSLLSTHCASCWHSNRCHRGLLSAVMETDQFAIRHLLVCLFDNCLFFQTEFHEPK